MQFRDLSGRLRGKLCSDERCELTAAYLSLTFSQNSDSAPSLSYQLCFVSLVGLCCHAVTLSHCQTDIYISDIIFPLATLLTVWLC